MMQKIANDAGVDTRRIFAVDSTVICLFLYLGQVFYYVQHTCEQAFVRGCHQWAHDLERGGQNPDGMLACILSEAPAELEITALGMSQET